MRTSCFAPSLTSLQTVLDTSDPTELREAGAIELSTDEDNVTSLAVGQKKGKATHVYAGVNSGPKDVEAGKNSHFRIFALEEQATKKKDAATPKTVKLSQISKTSMFQGKEKYTYQRVTRLSKPYPGQTQLGAVTTGDAKAAEILLFDTSAITTPVSRGALYSNKEAVDVDVLQVGDGEYMFAYADVHDIYVKKITKELDEAEPECVYITPASRSNEGATIPSFRSLRWLTKDLIVMLTNIHSTGGVVLQIFRTPPSGKGQCRIAQSVRLPDNIKKATGMAVANLTPPLTHSATQGYTQFVIAVAGQSSSISLFKVDLQVEGVASIVSTIKAFRTFKKVHPAVITSLSFSNFVPPTHPVTASTPPQNLKLASTGVSNTVVVHTIPLFPVPLSVSRGQSKTPRYVVALPSNAATNGIMAGVSFLAILFSAIFIQAMLEIRGAPSYVGARDYVPVRLQEALGRPYEFPKGYAAISSVTDDFAAATESIVAATQSIAAAADPKIAKITKFFDRLKRGSSDGIFVLDGEGEDVRVRLHDEEREGAHRGKTWDQLAEDQKVEWRRKLKDAGHWAEGVPEAVFKGVFFGEIAGAIGQAVGGG